VLVLRRVRVRVVVVPLLRGLLLLRERVRVQMRRPVRRARRRAHARRQQPPRAAWSHRRELLRAVCDLRFDRLALFRDPPAAARENRRDGRRGERVGVRDACVVSSVSRRANGGRDDRKNRDRSRNVSFP
jgi:hypothetical protein